MLNKHLHKPNITRVTLNKTAYLLNKTQESLYMGPGLNAPGEVEVIIEVIEIVELEEHAKHHGTHALMLGTTHSASTRRG